MIKIKVRVKEGPIIDIDGDEAFTMFVSLLIRDLSPFKKANEDRRVLLKKLWDVCPKRRKEESLWTTVFRGQMDRMGLSYDKDLEELGIPKVLEEDEE